MKSNAKQRILVAGLLCFFGMSPLWSQPKPVLGILPFEGPEVQADERQTIEYLIQSYISQLDLFRLIRTSDRDKVLAELEFSLNTGEDAWRKAGTLLAADYLLSGNIGAIDDKWVLTLEVVKVSSGEKKSVSNVYQSMSELALDSHALVRQIFDTPQTEPVPAVAKKALVINPESLYGLWQGDSGIEYVRILTGNRALAILSSGAQMELAYTISADSVEFIQTSPNTLRYFHPAPYAIAVQLVEIAEPVRWVFKLSSDGKQLSGTKYGTAVRYERDKILEVYRGRSRETEWNKSTR